MQKLPVWKVVFIVFTLLLSLWMLMPTLEFYSYDPVARNTLKSPKIEELEAKLESLQAVIDKRDADPAEIEKAKTEAAAIIEQIREETRRFRGLRDDAIRLGLDLQGGVHLALEVNQEKFLQKLREQNKSEEEINYAKEMVLDGAMAVIENRVDAFGVSEVALVKQPPWRVVLEMPGFNNPDQVAELVKADAELSFHIVAPRTELGTLIADIDNTVPEDFRSLVPDADPYVAAVAAESPDNVRLVDQILKRPVVQSLIPREYTFKWGGEQPANQWINYPHKYLYLLRSRAELTGDLLESAWVYFDPMSNRPEVMLDFNSKGEEIFTRVTGQNVGEHMAIVMNDQVYSAPRIVDRIRSDKASITGIDSYEEAKQIAVVLRAGALPAPMEVAQSRVVGPSLGQDSIRYGLVSGFIGALCALGFMALYYAGSGLIADFAVLLNIFYLLAGMAMFKATLTLPGIAGIFLTVGMATDANVLIFERLREEMRNKRSKTLQLVLDKGYSRAFMTIFDSNLTTLITALVLFQFGTGPIKGFAVTLSLGILISMFTAVFVCRVIQDYIVSRGVKELSLGTMRLFQNANYDFFHNAKAMMTLTWAIGVAGMLLLIFNWGHLQGIDFAGGDEVLVKFEKPINVQEVRDGLNRQGITDATIQQVLGEENQMLIRVRAGVVESPEALAGMIQQAIASNPFTVISSESVGAKVGSELLFKGINCLIFSSIGILIYITIRFEFRFALAAVIALFHDLFFTLGLIAFSGTEFNLPIVAALLTVLGYSINDTIVVFDRVRENYTSAVLNFKETVNTSINQTLSRTIITGGSTLMVLIALFLFGGPVIHDFAFVLLVGTVIGTYSSIFVASPVLLMLGPSEPVAEVPARKRQREPQPALVS
ncbi:MAG: protein translocase subunit SecD [Candidatus Omnitrophica bacterium]|nr:protein translocase subunit SecD [Candidatus Omnitrophota bacterium]